MTVFRERPLKTTVKRPLAAQRRLRRRQRPNVARAPSAPFAQPHLTHPNSRAEWIFIDSGYNRSPPRAVYTVERANDLGSKKTTSCFNVIVTAMFAGLAPVSCAWAYM